MRQMLAVVASRVPPAAVRVEGPCLRRIERRVPIRLIHQAGTAFLLEIINRVRKRVAFQQVCLDEEWV